MIRYSYAGGVKEFTFFNSFPAFQARLSALSPRTSIIVFRDKYLPLRGIVDHEFISAAIALVPDGAYWLVASLQLTTMGKATWRHEASGLTHTELREELEDQFGKDTAFGLHPPWLEDNEAVISAIIPEPDGSVVCGAY